MLFPLGTCIEFSSQGKAAMPPRFWLLSHPGDLLNSTSESSLCPWVFFLWKPECKWGWWVPRSWPNMKMSHSGSTNIDLGTWKHHRIKHINNVTGMRNSAVTPWSCSQTRHQKASRCGGIVPFPTGPCERTIAPYCQKTQTTSTPTCSLQCCAFPLAGSNLF